MILVCGGLADSVTELVCARLQDCGYPFRLLDLGSYPTGFKIRWHWRGSVPEGLDRRSRLDGRPGRIDGRLCPLSGSGRALAATEHCTPIGAGRSP